MCIMNESVNSWLRSISLRTSTTLEYLITAQYEISAQGRELLNAQGCHSTVQYRVNKGTGHYAPREGVMHLFDQNW